MRVILLSLLIIIPFFSSFFAFFSYRFKKILPRWIALIGIVITLLIVIQIWIQENYHTFQSQYYSNWNRQLVVPWISRFGIEFNIAIDGLSFLMLILTLFLSIIAVFCSWNEIKKNEGFFYFNFLLVLTGVIGVFISFDLFLFFFFWEIMLVPMYFLIALWGNNTNKKNNAITAANKFFIYTQLSGLIMLFSILVLVFSYYQSTNILTFNYNLLLSHNFNQNIEYIVMLGFFLAFSVKMPIVPFHGWLPDVHKKSLSCGSVEIIGLLLKTAPYALLRFNLTLFSHSTEKFTPFAVFLGLISIFYGSFLAFSQNNIKKLIAYSSISHMGLILLSIYSNNEIALQGAIIQILSSSICTAALCVLSGHLYKRLKTQDIRQMGGLWGYIYWVPGFSLFFSLANLGLPGTGNFIGEFLILSGLFQEKPLVSVLATISILFSSIYSLNMIQRIFYGKHKTDIRITYLNKKEIFTIAALVLMLLFLGLKPQSVLNISYSSIHNIHKEFTNSISEIRL